MSCIFSYTQATGSAQRWVHRVEGGPKPKPSLGWGDTQGEVRWLSPPCWASGAQSRMEAVVPYMAGVFLLINPVKSLERSWVGDKQAQKLAGGVLVSCWRQLCITVWVQRQSCSTGMGSELLCRQLSTAWNIFCCVRQRNYLFQVTSVAVLDERWNFCLRESPSAVWDGGLHVCLQSQAQGTWAAPASSTAGTCSCKGRVSLPHKVSQSFNFITQAVRKSKIHPQSCPLQCWTIYWVWTTKNYTGFCDPENSTKFL